MTKITVLLMAVFFAGCSNVANTEYMTSSSSGVQREAISKKMRILNKGKSNLKIGDYSAASDNFNEVLRGNISNATFQTLNGMAYHMEAIENDAEQINLAEQGYELAAKFDPSDWVPLYLNGLAKLSQKRYNAAKLNLIKAVTRDWKNDRAMFSLMAAAYYDTDFVLALKSLSVLQGRVLEPNLAIEVERACAIIKMAVNDRLSSNQCLQNYLAIEASAEQKSTLQKRLDILRSINSIKQPVQNGSLLYKVQNTEESEPDTLVEERMVVVDVVIIGSTEDIRNKSGLNILNGLAIQFGNTAEGVAAFSQSRSIANDNYDTDDEEQSRTIVRALTVPAIQYSLNILNSSDSDNRILAKPSLIALSGETSTFFSGVTINGAATSGAGNSIEIEREIGVTLSVTPEFLEGDRVMLKVDAERTFLMDPASNVIYEFRMDTSKTTVNANVVMNIGETLVIGGLTEQQDSKALDGVPGLRQVPGLKLLFSSEEDRRYKKTVTILLTPRLAVQNEKSSHAPAVLPKVVDTPDMMILKAMFEQHLPKPLPLWNNNQMKMQAFGKQYISDTDVAVRASRHEIMVLAEQLIQRSEKL